MDLELRHLRIVRAVADAGSLSKAATRLGLAQPALTAQLKRIERLLGGSLFKRDRTGAHPTPLGELVIDRARVLLPAAKELQDEAARFASEPTTRFRIGATSGAILGGLVERLTAHGPVRTCTSWSARELAAMTELGRLDYALVGVCGGGLPPGDSISWAAIGVDPVFVLLGLGHPLSSEKELDLAELAGEAWAVNPGDGCFVDCFATACTRAGFTPGTIYESDVATCVHLARVGQAAILCQATHVAAPGLVMIPLRGAPLRWRHLLGWHPATPGSALVLDQARRAHAEAVRRSPVYREWLTHNPVIGAK